MLLLVSLSIGDARGQSALAMRFPESTRFVAAHGRYAWAGGYGDRGLEVWAGALQIATGIHPEFRREGDVTAVSGILLPSTISVEPSHVTRVYTGSDFSVREEIWVPLEQAAVLVRYNVLSVRPVGVIVRFRPTLNLMWPAALGGQEIHWESSAYLLGDSAHQFAALVLAPGAIAHDEPLNSARTLPQSGELAVALDPKSPEVLFARVSAKDLKAGRVEAEKLLASNAWQQESAKHYEDVLNSDLQIETPDADLNRALAWAEIALDQDWFCNEALGCGYVAGFGPSRRNRRPQYAWYFAGDGMIALHAAMATGDLDRAREELRFIAKYQDAQTGMIWHELSQSAPYIDWRGKYPYMFVHADLTYPYISSVADYVRASNDMQFLREIWPSVQKAFQYGRSLIANDGLPRIPTGKEGANEQNPLADELGLSASWVVACRDYAHLAKLMGNEQAAEASGTLAKKARASFAQRYWDSRKNFPIEGYRRNGEPVMDRGLSAVAAVTDSLLSEDRSAQVLNEIASWRFQSDWGTRSVAVGEPGYDPVGYAHGSVWALGTANVAQAYWSEHRPEIAWQIWRSLTSWSMLDSPGHMHEVLAGDTYHPQVESVPEQSWSSAAFLTAAVRGLFGVEINGETGTLKLAPHLPAEWDHASIRNIRIGNSTLDFTIHQRIDGLRMQIRNSGETVHMMFEPEIPLGVRSVTSIAGTHKIPVTVVAGGEDQHVKMTIGVPQGDSEINLDYRGGVAVGLPAVRPSLGDPSTGMKLTSIHLSGNVLRLGVDLMPGQHNALHVLTRRSIQASSESRPARLNGDSYEILVEPAKSDPDKYQHREITITLGKWMHSFDYRPPNQESRNRTFIFGCDVVVLQRAGR